MITQRPISFPLINTPRRGFTQEITGNQRNRRYRYDPFLALFDTPEFVAGQDDNPVETTRRKMKRGRSSKGDRGGPDHLGLS